MKTCYGIETSSPEEIRAVQDSLLGEAVAYVYERSPFYKRLFRESGVSPGDIRGVDDLQSLPFTTREDLQKHNEEFLAVSENGVSEIVSTSGTGGEPVFIAMTRNDLERLAYNEELSFTCAGASRGDFFHIAVTCDNLFIAGTAYYSGLIRLGARVTRVGPQNTLRHADLIGRLRPDGIVGVPSLMLELARLLRERGLETSDTGLKRLVLIGDSIRDADLGTNTLGRLIEDFFGKICYSTYGITEGQVSFCECGERKGLHSHPELVIPEIVDEDGNVLPDGETGELVITTLQMEGMPLVRYRTGDITFRISGRCGCGRNSVRIGPILGRKQQRLKLKGVTLYPKNIENAILGMEDVINFQIEAYTGDDGTDRIILRIGSYRNDSGFIPELVETLRAKVRVTPEIVIEPPEMIKKRLFEGGSRKARIFIDRRDKDI